MRLQPSLLRSFTMLQPLPHVVCPTGLPGKFLVAAWLKSWNLVQLAACRTSHRFLREVCRCCMAQILEPCPACLMSYFPRAFQGSSWLLIGSNLATLSSLPHVFFGHCLSREVLRCCLAQILETCPACIITYFPEAFQRSSSLSLGSNLGTFIS